MKLNVSLLLTAVSLAALGADAAAFTLPHPCLDFPTKVSKLTACATASQFCSSYLGGTASLTHTTTTTTTVPFAPITTTTTTTVTATSTRTIATTTSAITSTVTGSTSTTTQFSTVCGGGASKLKPREPATEVQGASSCGILPNADPFQVSGACNCILASSMTVTKTLTSGVALVNTVTKTHSATSTASVTSTTTTTSTTTFTPVETSCYDSFYLQLDAPGLPTNGDVASLSFSGYSGYSMANFDSTYLRSQNIFTIDANGHLGCDGLLAGINTAVDTSGLDSAVEFDTPAEMARAGDVDVTCSITSTQQLECTGGSRTESFVCHSLYAFYLLDSDAEVTGCEEAQIFAIPA